MARKCSVCEHPDRPAIEIALANGVATRPLGLRYGLDSTQLHRHKTTHMTAELAARLRVTRHKKTDAEIQALRELESKSLLDHLAWQRARMYDNADRCIKIGDDAGERAAMSEASKMSERIAKLLGELGSHITVNNNTQINLVQSPQWHHIRTALVRELKPLGADAIAAGARAIECAEKAIMRPDDIPLIEVIEHE